MINHNNRNFKLVDTFPEIKQSYQGFWIHSQNNLASINRIFLFLLHCWTKYKLNIFSVHNKIFSPLCEVIWLIRVTAVHNVMSLSARCGVTYTLSRSGKKPSWSHLIKGPKQITLIDAAKSGNYSSHGQLKRVLFVMSVLKIIMGRLEWATIKIKTFLMFINSEQQKTNIIS